MGIVIIDDSKSTRLLIRKLLEKKGYKVLKEFSSAREAIKSLGIHAKGGEKRVAYIDLILMDIVMDELDGIEACSYIKSDPNFTDVPIIMLTSETKSHWLEKAFKSGAIDYIKKQGDKIELYARVESALKLHREIRERKKREQELQEMTRYLEQVNKELEQKNNQLEKMVNIDGLTQIANRRFFDEILQREWQKAKSDKSALSLIICDIDYFKYYNDNHGHQAGDECLKRVARKLENIATRPYDLVARYGGEEFGIILPETSLKGALNIGNKIRKGIESMYIPLGTSKDASSYLTISVGVASIDFCFENEESLNDFLNRADQALYRAKGQGRNTVEYIS